MAGSHILPLIFNRRPGRSSFEAFGQRVGVLREKAEIGADGDERVAPPDETFGLFFVGCEDAGGFADFFQPHLGLSLIHIS